MIYKNTDMYTLLDITMEKTLICFGAGQQLQNACELFSDVQFFDRIDFIADNNREKHSFGFSGAEKPVHSIEECIRCAIKEPVILITISDCFDIIDQLDKIPVLNKCKCFVYSFVRELVHHYSLPINRAKTEPLKIPRRIHYCWFGGTSIPDEFKMYIDTWGKLCPDYEIIRWDESNYDYKKNEYMYEAYRQKKWGFVPDFARLDIIYRYGGIYLDTDVELIRNIDDLLCDDAFCGFESRRFVANGLGFGAVAGFPLMQQQMEIYNSLSFINKDGSLNLKAAPQYQTEFFCSLGLSQNGTLQNIHGMTIYPQDVLAPLNAGSGIYNLTENTYSIHHYSATWQDDMFHQNRNRRVWEFQTLSEKINFEEGLA